MNRQRLVLSAGCWVLSLMCWVLSAGIVYADLPHLIRYQGQAVDSQGVPLEGPYTLTFRLYDAATVGTKLWEEVQPNVPLQGGHFSVLLGQITPLNGMNWGLPCWLSVQVGTEPELAPRQPITSVPLAIRAEEAERLSGANIGARVTHSLSQSIPNATLTVLSFDSERWDTNGIHDPTTNNSRLVCKTSGMYLIFGHVLWDVNGTGARRIDIRLNGTTPIGIQEVQAASGFDFTILSVATTYPLNANDYVELVAYQASGGALSVGSASNYTPEFGMVKLP
jgi:hypothetical protein